VSKRYLAEFDTSSKRLRDVVWREQEEQVGGRVRVGRWIWQGRKPINRLFDKPRYSRLAHCPMDSGIVPRGEKM
jgi:hypothetical protein